MKINKKTKSDLMLEQYTTRLIKYIIKSNRIATDRHQSNASRIRVHRAVVIFEHITKYLFNFKDIVDIEVIIDFCNRTKERKHIAFFKKLLIQIKYEREIYE